MKEGLECPHSLLPHLYRWSLTFVDLVGVESLPEVAVDLLSAGFDTPEVVRLAVCDRDEHPDDVRRAAGRAFASLGFTPQDASFHQIVVGRMVAAQIADSVIQPLDGLAKMVSLWIITCHSEIFTEWMILDEAIYLFRNGDGGLEPYLDLTEETIPSTIYTLTQQFLVRHPIPYRP